jgi:hypothetical protein
MLASTVQFSNNDQPPITPPSKGECTGAGNRRHRQKMPVPSDTQQRARPDRPFLAFHAEAVLAEKQPVVPNSQRSTLEQPPSNICRRNGLWIPCGT